MKTVLLTAILAMALSGVTEAQWIQVRLAETPRTPEGTPDLGAPAPRTLQGKPDLSGIWLRVRPTKSIPGPTNQNLRYLLNDGEDVPYQPWARKVYEQRIAQEGAGSPGERCLPEGVPGAMLPPVPFKIVQGPGLTMILFEVSNEYRQIHTDGRTHPTNPNPTWWGYSVGGWEGDSLVVNTSGFNDLTWLDKAGHPHTEALKITERFRRTTFGRMELEVTVDDAQAYTRPWKVLLPFALQADTELIEDECENEKDAARIDAARRNLSDSK